MENKANQVTTEIDIDHEEIEFIAINSICRLCASQNDHLIGVYSEEGISKDLATKINLYLPVKVAVSDELPLQCCWSCTTTILAWHELVLTCVESDRKFRSAHLITEKTIIPDPVYDNQGTGSTEDNTGSKDELSDEGKHVEMKQKRRRRRNADIVAHFFCDVCDKGFTRKYDMEKHKLRLHSSQSAETSSRKRNAELLDKCRRRDDDGKVFFECDYCERAFAQSYNLMRHRTIHTGVRAYFCHICGKSFRMSNGLTRHIDAFHHGVKNFRCEVCEKTFTARATRDEHMNIHTNNRPFVCDICGKSFKQKASLHVHKMFHSDMYRFECGNCGKKFRRAQDLKVHSWLHTGHRPYSCGECKAAFRLGHDLKRHLRVHEKRSECVCNECGSVFTQERYLKVHRKIHKRPGLVVKLEEIV